jgi:hypothetical protein
MNIERKKTMDFGKKELAVIFDVVDTWEGNEAQLDEILLTVCAAEYQERAARSEDFLSRTIETENEERAKSFGEGLVDPDDDGKYLPGVQDYFQNSDTTAVSNAAAALAISHADAEDMAMILKFLAS